MDELADGLGKEMTDTVGDGTRVGGTANPNEG